MDVALLSTKELIQILQNNNQCSACRYEAAYKLSKISNEKPWITESIINEADKILSTSKPLHDYKKSCLAYRPSELCPKCLSLVDAVPARRVGLKCSCQKCKTELAWAVKWINNRYLNQISTPKAIFYLVAGPNNMNSK